MKTLHAFVSGRVQGVFYRASLAEQARSLGLNGWVRNLADGRVEYVVQGPDDKIEALRQWSLEGPAHAKVMGLDATELAESEDYSDFSIR